MSSFWGARVSRCFPKLEFKAVNIKVISAEADVLHETVTPQQSV
jgi:hypothetical protein